MELGQIQNSLLAALGITPPQPIVDPPAPPDPPILDPQPPEAILPDYEPPADPLPESMPASRPSTTGARPKGPRSARELPSLGGIPLGQLKSLLQASQNAALLAAAIGGSPVPAVQISVSIQKVYLGDQLVATGSTLDIKA